MRRRLRNIFGRPRVPTAQSYDEPEPPVTPPRTPAMPRIDPGYLDMLTGKTQKKSRFHVYKYPTDMHKETAVYGTKAGLGIHGPVDYDVFYPDWSSVGTQYQLPPQAGQPFHQVHSARLSQYGIVFQNLLGSGNYGTVYVTQVSGLIRDRDQNLITMTLACKILSLSRFSRNTRNPMTLSVDSLIAESNLHSSLDHPNIVKAVEIFYIYDEVSNFPKPIHVLHFMELCEGDLKSLIKAAPDRRLKEAKSREWFVQIASAMKYLHDNNVVHMDLKPDNILYMRNPRDMNQFLYKLSDFGFAQRFIEFSAPISTEPRGTFDYMAPEVRNQLTMGQGFDATKADVWSLGIVLAESIAGRARKNTPFSRYPLTFLLQAALHWTQSVYTTWGLSPAAAELLNWMTHMDVQARYSMDEVVSHSFVADVHYQSGQWSRGGKRPGLPKYFT